MQFNRLAISNCFLLITLFFTPIFIKSLILISKITHHFQPTIIHFTIEFHFFLRFISWANQWLEHHRFFRLLLSLCHPLFRTSFFIINYPVLINLSIILIYAVRYFV